MTMSQNVSIKRYNQSRRLEILKEELPKGTSQAAIAEVCGVTRRTIARDIQKWKADGGFEDWLDEEFFQLHSQVRDEDAETAYKVIARLKEKTMVRRIETEQRVEIRRKPVDMREALSEYGPVIAMLLYELEREASGEMDPGEPGAEQMGPCRVEGTARNGPEGGMRFLTPHDQDGEASSRPEYVRTCPRCGGAPTFDRSLGEWICSSCSSPLRLLAGKNRPEEGPRLGPESRKEE